MTGAAYEHVIGGHLRQPTHDALLLPEILAVIFQMYTSDARDTDVKPGEEDTSLALKPSYPKTAPWAPMRVCSSWRRVALSTPQLWSEFSSSFSGSGCRDFRGLESNIHRMKLTITRTTAAFKAHLKHSRNAPLTLSFSARRFWDSHHEAHHQFSRALADLLQLSIPHQRRWYKFSLLYDCTTPSALPDGLDDAFRLVLAEAPLLREFKFVVPNCKSNVIFAPPSRLALWGLATLTVNTINAITWRGNLHNGALVPLNIDILPQLRTCSMVIQASDSTLR